MAFVIATHSPMLLTFPGATVLTLEDGTIRSVSYEETSHYRVTRDFLNAPQRFYQQLFDPQSDPPAEAEPGD